MSDDERPRYNLKKAGRYIRDIVGSNGECPICKNTSWVVETGDDENWYVDTPAPAPAYVMKETRGWLGPAPAIPTFALTCKKCGFIRQHNLEWIEQKIAEGSADE